ncbi:MAG: Ig-like domain-containing protein [bacterium]
MVAGSPKPKYRAPARILMVAAVLLLGSLMPAIGPAAAQSGSTTLMTGPFFDDAGSQTFPHCPTTPTNPALKAQNDDGIWQVRQVTVISSTDVNQVTFDYVVGTGTGVGANQRIEWGTSTAGSKAAGWPSISVSNGAASGNLNRLTFSGGTLSHLSLAGQVFTIAFRVIGSPAADVYTQLGAGKVSVTAGSKDVVGTGTAFTQFFAVGNTFKVSGDAHQYKVASIQDATHLKLTDKLVGSSITPTTALNYTKIDPATTTTPATFPVKVDNDASICIVIDMTPPHVISAYTRDTNFNGLLDEMVLTFDEEMDPTTLNPASFAVNASSSGEPIPYSVLPSNGKSLVKGLGSDDGHFSDPACTTASPPANACVNLEKTLKLSLAEGYKYDTGVLPEVTYPKAGESATFSDLAHNPLANITNSDLTEVDGAKPVLVSVFDFEGATSMIATFSEPVTGSGPKSGAQAGDVDNCIGGLGCVRTTDFFYYDRCAGKLSSDSQCNPATGLSHMSGTNCITAQSGLSPEIGVSMHTPGPTNGNTVTLPVIAVASDPGCDVAGKGQGVKGYVGKGDAQQALGDVIALNTMASEPVSSITCPGIDFLPCGALVRDATGLRGVPTAPCSIANVCNAGAGPGGGANGIKGATSSLPLVVDAVVNIDTFQVTLNFNGPVSDASGDDKPLTLQDLTVISADGPSNSQGPGGITQILHRAGASRAILTLDKKVRPTDVDDTPTKIGIKCNAIKGTRQAAFVPCGDPDGTGGSGVALIDNVLPAILKAETVDMDRDGQVDGLFLEFNEPVDDTTFCQLGNAPPPAECYPGSGGVGLQVGKYHHPADATGPETKYVFDTDASPGGVGAPISVDQGNGQPNDRFGIIKFVNPFKQPIGLGTADPADTAITTTAAGLFSDLSHPGPPTQPPYAQAKQMAQICPTGCLGSVKLLDGAPPVLLSALTVDTRLTVPGAPTVNDLEGDGYLDGYRMTFSEPVLDKSFCHNNLQTGPVYLCNSVEWAVEGHKVIGMRTRDPNVVDLTGLTNVDNEVTLLFAPGDHPDTGERPKLTYFGPSQPTYGFKDLQGVQMLPLQPIDGFEEDDAAPVITLVEGFLGRNNVTIRFSEPVDNGQKGALGRSSLLYFNIDHLPDGVSGLSSQDAVVHFAATDNLIAHLNCPVNAPKTVPDCGNIGLQVHDIQNDTISAELNSIWETSPSVPSPHVVSKKSVSVKNHHLGNAIDIFRPANVTQFQVVKQLTSANSVTLSWKAPGNDGNGFGSVRGYRIKVSTQKIAPGDFNVSSAPGSYGLGDSNPNATLNADGSANIVRLRGDQVYAILSPDAGGLAGPGEYQQATIIGLQAQTTYHFAVEAFDAATLPPCYTTDAGHTTFAAPVAACPSTNTKRVDFRHFSGMRPDDVSIAATQYDVSTATGIDLTPPVPTPVIASTTHPANRPDPKMTAIFSWTNATDGESTVNYHYALNTDPQYKVLVTDLVYTGAANLPSVSIPIPSRGTWYFHVAAFSGGGSTATAHYTIIVDRPTIDPADIRERNDLVLTNATRDGATNSVTWHLPDQALLPPGGQLEGVDIYAIEGCGSSTGCTVVNAHSITGTYDQLQSGTWTDDRATAGSVTGYRVEMVFANAQTQTPTGGSHSVQGFAAIQEQPGHDNSALWWLLAAVLLVLVAAGIAFLVIRSKRANAAAFEEIPSESTAAGMDPVTGLPAHDVRCPSCQTAFQAVGNLPLQITCPNCGVSGLLQ